MKKFLIFFCAIMSFMMFGCSKDEPVVNFSKVITEAKSYKAEGTMISYYEEGTKENNFVVYYKEPNLIKVVITSSDDESNKQVILKNSEGVYILIPAVNKNFKIQSTWPENASYPYLLHSLSKDIINTPNAVTKSENGLTNIDTNTKMYADAVATKQIITLDENTSLPVTVKVYNEQGELYILVNFRNIQLDFNIPDEEFVASESMIALRKKSLSVFNDRVFSIPTYIPSGYSVSQKDIIVTGEENNLTQIMMFTGENTFTVIQEYVNDAETMSEKVYSGEIILIKGFPAIYTNSAITLYNEGMNYTLASSSIEFNEIVKIAASYIKATEK